MSTASHEVASFTGDLYPSRRRGEGYRFLARRDPLVYGAGKNGPLSTAELDSYGENGFLLLPALLDNAEIEPHRDELNRMRKDPVLCQRPEAIAEPDSGALRSVFAVHLGDSPLARLCRDPRLVAIARQLLGSDIYIHQSRINYKPGFRGRDFFWHSDFETWHVEDGMPCMRAVSCSISLEANHDTNSPLMLVPGSHKRFLACAGETPEEHYKWSLKRQELGVPDEPHLCELIGAGGLTTATGPAGSVTFFECNLMHGSNSNITPWPRSNVFVVFNSVENRLAAPYCGLRPRPEFVAHRKHVKPAGG